MADVTTKIAIVGCGPGSPQYVTEAARNAVAVADALVGSQRLIDLFSESPPDRIMVGPDIPDVLQQMVPYLAAGRTVAVLVSGDPGLCSLAARVIRHFGRRQCHVVPAVSSVQAAFAKAGLDWSDARIVSAHGREPNVDIADLGGADKIAVLAGTTDAIQWAAQAATALRATHIVLLAENLTLDDERFRELAAEQLYETQASSLSIVLLIRRTLWT
ncbi:MAG: precorrin-6y C5,15-methyltransferase (decarboxylating) subunit CbiE [Planctomycetaceae bacterium]|nr:MAG: precorrin-6y C5,15-methyltransferase (decarboxylating) subunit CbiE [Planctomycetaceae bacterium]